LIVTARSKSEFGLYLKFDRIIPLQTSIVSYSMPLPPKLAAILNPAYRPCPHLGGACKDLVWDPEHGRVPRGYFGAPCSVSDIELVIVLAEPSSPVETKDRKEDYSWLADCADIASAMADCLTKRFLNRDSNDVFARNLASIIQHCWTPLDLETAIQRTWVTESVLCSAKNPCDPILPEAERTCGENYLVRELRLFPTAFLVALGRKAQNRLHALGYEPTYAPSPAKPSGNWHSSKDAWARLGERFHEWRKRRNEMQPQASPTS